MSFIKTGDAFKNTQDIVRIAQQALRYLNDGRIDDFGALLNATWNIKKKFTENITNDTINEIYDIGMRNGALGGKLLGAGGGGFLIFYVPLKKQLQLLDAMKKYDPNCHFPVSFEKNGVKRITI